MLLRRVIPCLDVDKGRVVKGVEFLNLRDAGDPVELAVRYQDEVADGELDRISCVADVDEVGPLDDPSTVDVETRDDALEDHGYARAAGFASSTARASSTVKRPS